MNSRKLLGHTLIEVVAVLAVLGLIAIYAIPKVEEEWSERIVNHAASRVHDVFTAARRYRLDTQSWPTSSATLVSGGYLTSAMASPPLGGSYSFNVITTAAGEHFELQFSAGQGIYANRLLARLPNARRIGVADVASVIPIPGHEPSYDALDEKYYHRDGSRDLTGPLAGGDQDALDLNEVHANLIVDREDITKILDPAGLSVIHNLEVNRVDANRVETDVLKMTQVRRSGDPCSNAVGDIGITSSGELVTCKGGNWTTIESSVFRNIGPIMLSGTWVASSDTVRNASAYVLRTMCSTQGSSTVTRAYANNRKIYETWYHESGRGGGNDSIFILQNTSGRISTRWTGDCSDGRSIQLVGYFT